MFDQVSFDRARLVAVAHVSNVTGTIAPIAELAARAHAAGALVVVDGAQAVAHLPVDVAALGCDFYAFSGHKLYGPTGIGVLWGRADLLAALPPWQTGGGMVGRPPPARFEAGTPNVIGIAGLAAAIAYLRAFDPRPDEARAHAELVRVIHAAGGQILGVPELAVVAFELPRVHPHDVATLADAEGVALRSGHHCAAPIHARFGVAASSRVSVGCYTDPEDVAQLAGALAKIREVFP
ncbi:MAG: aminotransferase class V-fold PLP-dependent enzyme [Kofleriaceae bacterium]